MRKLTAWVLALVMMCMPLVSLAESHCMDVQLTQIDLSTVMETWLDTELLSDDYVSLLQKAIDFAEELLKSSTLRLQWQEDGVRLAWLVEEQEAMSATVMEQDGALVLTNSITPDYALVLSYDTVQTAAAEVDWASFAQALMNETSNWAMELAVTDETGDFADNAYEGGVYRVCVPVTDQDIALLLDGLMLCLEENEDVYALVKQMQGSDDVLHQARRAILSAAQSSTYHYELIAVGDSTGTVIGMTVNVYESETLLGSLSVGASDGWTAVLSFPVNNTACYLDLHIGDNTLTMNAYQCDSGVTYQEAKAQKTWKTMSLSIQADIAEENGQYTGSVKGTSALYAENLTLTEEQTWSGTVASDFSSGSIDMTEKYNGSKFLHAAMTLGLGDDITMPENLTYVNVLTASAEEQQAFEDAIYEGLDQSTITMFKVLPLKLLRKLVELQQEMNNYQQVITQE